MKTSIILVTCDLCGREEETREDCVLIKEPDNWYTIMISKEGKTKEGVLGVFSEDDSYPYPFLDVCPPCFEAKVKPFMDSLVGQKVTIR